MKTVDSLSSFQLITLACLFTQAASHGVEVAHCLTASGSLRIFVKSWHVEVTDASEAGTMIIHDHQTGANTELAPHGWVKNKPGTPSLDLPGCGDRIEEDKMCTSGHGDAKDWEDWAYYDFDGLECNIPVTYEFLKGTTVILQDGCVTQGTPLYPVTISETFVDTLDPTIYLNGEICEDGTVIESDTCLVYYDVTATDDCGDPDVTVSIPSGSSFDAGDTTVEATATDNSGKTSTCNFIVRRDSGCDCGHNRQCSIRPDPHYYLWDDSYYDYQGSCDQYAIKNSLLELQVRTRGRGTWSTVVEVALLWLPTGEYFQADGEGTTNGKIGQYTTTFTSSSPVDVQDISSYYNTYKLDFKDDSSSSYIKITFYGEHISVEVVGTGNVFCGSEGMLGSWKYGGAKYSNGADYVPINDWYATRATSINYALDWKVAMSDSRMNNPSDICIQESTCGTGNFPPCSKMRSEPSCNSTCNDLTDEKTKSECIADNELMGEENNIFACNPAAKNPEQCENECDTDPSTFSDSPPVCRDSTGVTCGILGLVSFVSPLLCWLPLFSDDCRILCGLCCEDDSSFTFTTEDEELQNCAWISGQSDETIEDYCSNSSIQGKCPKTCGTCPA